VSRVVYMARCKVSAFAVPLMHVHCNTLALLPKNLKQNHAAYFPPQVVLVDDNALAKCMRYGAWSYATHDHTVETPKGRYSDPDMEPGWGVSVPHRRTASVCTATMQSLRFVPPN
jgi:hypothetical protein